MMQPRQQSQRSKYGAQNDSWLSKESRSVDHGHKSIGQSLSTSQITIVQEIADLKGDNLSSHLQAQIKKEPTKAFGNYGEIKKVARRRDGLMEGYHGLRKSHVDNKFSSSKSFFNKFTDVDLEESEVAYGGRQENDMKIIEV